MTHIAHNAHSPKGGTWTIPGPRDTATLCDGELIVFSGNTLRLMGPASGGGAVTHGGGSARITGVHAPHTGRRQEGLIIEVDQVLLLKLAQEFGVGDGDDYILQAGDAQRIRDAIQDWQWIKAGANFFESLRKDSTCRSADSKADPAGILLSSNLLTKDLL